MKPEIPFSRTTRNFTKPKKEDTSKSKPRPKGTSRSKKIFVVKSPMVFEDEMIPKAEMATSAWNQIPLTGKERGRKS